ncbi:reverse transcriptase domain-containing protein [Tanacetum coccineum]
MSKLKKQKKDDEEERLLSIFKQIHINLPFLEAMIHMPKGAKVLKDLLSHNEKLEKVASSVKLSEVCFAIIQRSLPQKEGDPGSFTLPCLIGPLAIKNALAYLGASINLMPHSVFRRLRISKLKPTKMSIQLVDRSVKYPIRVYDNLLVKVSKFIFPVDFVVFEMDKDELVLIILGWPFLATTEEEEEDSNKALAVSFYPRAEPVEPLEWKTLENRLKSSSVEPPKLELKELPEHLEYAFLQDNNQLPVVISSALSTDEKTRLLESMGKPCPGYPKEGGITVVKNEKDELIPQWTVARWRVCIDYRKLNNVTRKYHFPLPYINQMLERLAGHEYYCFLDEFSGYFQIPIAPEYQEKTTFTCPYGTFAYKRMPFGLCNASATFQRCMTAIFHELIEDSMEVFMDDFSVFGSSFNHCLKNLEKMLKEFDIEIHDKKGAKNLAADHLSRLEHPDLGKLTRAEIRDLFPEE